jgi:membrane-bound serine protease (ClpP class)
MRKWIGLLGVLLSLCSPLALAAGGALVSSDVNNPLLSYLTDPNIVYLLILIAIYGLFFEISNPGLILPGATGILALLLVLYAFQLMPINYLGLSLIFIGIGFMLAEVYLSTFGIIGLAGVIAFILGSIMLFNVNQTNYHLAWSLILIMSIISITFFWMIVSLAVKSHKKSVVTGKEGLIGMHGMVLNVMNEQVVVRVLGEIWEARCAHALERGQAIKVTHVNGLVLTVEPLKVPLQKK